MAYVESITAKNETRTIRDLNGQQMLATVQASTTASKAYAVGDYLILNDKIYTVTTAIASGGTITVGTNVTETKVGEKLTELNRQISETITPAIEQLAEDLDSKAPAIYETVSGEIASFDDGADGMPVKSLVANIEPVQDLHGYANPWPEGGGANKLIECVPGTYTSANCQAVVSADGTITLSGASGSSPEQIIIPLKAKIATPSEQFYIHLLNTANANVAPSFELSTNVAGTAIDVSCSPANRIFAVNTNRLGVEIDRIRFWIASNVNVTCILHPMFALANSVIPWTPYSNICPISGWTGASVTRTGKNLIFQKIYGFPNVFNHKIVIDNDTVTGFFWAEEGKSYVRSSSSSFHRSTVFRLSDQSMHQVVAYESYGESKDIASSVWTATWSGFTGWYCNPAKDETMFNTLQIELGSVATDYEPYQGNQISITFPSSAGTVYGGTLTLNPDRTGTLVVDKEMVDMGKLQWAYESNGDPATGNKPYFWWRNSNRRKVSLYMLCSMYKSTGGTRDSLVDKSIAAYNITNNKAVCVMDLAYSNVTEFQTAVNGAQLVYELADSVTYQLTASEISGILETLYGTNNIWADVGTVDVEYPADTKLYIDGKIAEAIANALNA